MPILRPVRVLLLLLLTTLVVPWPLPAQADEEAPSRADLERDLVLEAELASARTIQPGEPVRVRAKLVNRSATRAYRVVRPGDGSESGWREPHVFFTAESLDPRGIRRPVAEQLRGRCGNYDADWHDEVVTLAPGESLALQDWLPAPHHVLDFQRQGPVELFLHYRYARGRVGKGGPLADAPSGTGPMGNTPAFELRSNPVRFAVVRVVGLRLESLRDAVVGQPTRLSELLALHVENLGDGPRHVADAEIRLELHYDEGATPLLAERRTIPPSVERKQPPLGRGDTRSWEGAAAWRTLPDVAFTAARAGTLRVVAVWTPTGTKRSYRSEPCRVEIRAP